LTRNEKLHALEYGNIQNTLRIKNRFFLNVIWAHFLLQSKHTFLLQNRRDNIANNSSNPKNS